MDEKRRLVDTQTLMTAYQELLSNGMTVPLVVSGSSMTPFLAPGRDTVYLQRPEGPLRRGQMALYRRVTGAYVLHRVYAVTRDGYVMLGDAQTQREPGIAHQQILAVVSAAERKGKRQAPGSFWWMFFATVWLRLRPVRPQIMRAYQWCVRRK